MVSPGAGQLEVQQCHRTPCASIRPSGKASAVVIAPKASNKEAEELKHL
jgi:hypothetical protein